MKAFSASGAIEFLGDLETSFKCGSMCVTPLFAAIAPIVDGPVDRDCATAML